MFYFNEVYFGPVSGRYTSKSFGLDYLIGLVHFILFFAWSTAIDTREWAHLGASTHFVQMTALILSYDMVWLFVSWRYDASRMIKLWAAVNDITLLVMAVVFFALASVLDAIVREEIALLILALAGMVDIAEQINGKRYFENWIRSLLPEPG